VKVVSLFKRTWCVSVFFALSIFLLGTIANLAAVLGWSNGGFSTDPTNPDYGTHDWIAHHALDWLPLKGKQFILNNIASYLYGTELPDNGGAPDASGTPLNITCIMRACMHARAIFMASPKKETHTSSLSH